jgi:2-succinyl-5-enolpyruvyl-6-hydroxy-3-cyclohexene-1-carboxylate synthase
MKINRNIFWTNTFVDDLSKLGIRFVCISPGSRSTPLTYSFANNKKITSFVIIDERSSGFFALGLAKVSNSPVAVVCTSGTATAELYPAIIEAYQQRVPLIICTADRPPELHNVGANQTINQTNLYKNHIRWFIDVGLPYPTRNGINKIKSIAAKAYSESFIKSRGPVQLNFPFRKPFEPDTFTDEITNEIYRHSKSNIQLNYPVNKNNMKISDEKWFRNLLKQIKKNEKGLIIAGPGNYDPEFNKYCRLLSEMTSYPIIADGASQLRIGRSRKKNIISNFEGLFRSDKFIQKYKPGLILQFGRTVTSKGLELFFDKNNLPRYIINEFGDRFDPSHNASAVYACNPFRFCMEMSVFLKKDKFKRENNNWLNAFLKLDKISFDKKCSLINNSSFPNECRVIPEIVNLLPSNSQLMISNSMPIRDFDYFAPLAQKNINVFYNRGASGIDGITSTALGIAAANKKVTILLTGDLAFYHDFNGLYAAKKYSLPLIIILINNNGGGIFEVLPISSYKNIFEDYFITPTNLNFEKFVKAYEGNYFRIKSWNDLRMKFHKALKYNQFSVLEIKTNAAKSHLLRDKLWKEEANIYF